MSLVAEPQHSQQGQGQATYLNVQAPQEHSSSMGAPGQGSENKTIVLAIPAKINFLSENRSSSSYRQQQPAMPGAQQLTLIQPPGEQYYAPGKQLGKPLPSSSYRPDRNRVSNLSKNSDSR